jgi:hypothetical protein
MTMNNENEVPMVPRFQAENTIMHLGYANRRMLIALVTVCLTFLLTITVFVFGYTIREKNWLDTLTRVTNVEVTDGVHQQPDSGNH